MCVCVCVCVCARAQCNLAWMIHKRLVPPPRPLPLASAAACNASDAAVADAAARYWWRRAAAQGSGEGRLRLADSEYSRGDYAEARRLYELVGPPPALPAAACGRAFKMQGEEHERCCKKGRRGEGKRRGQAPGLF